MSIANEVDRMIEERSLLKHPFCQAWQRGDLTLGSSWRSFWPGQLACAPLTYCGNASTALWGLLDGVERTRVATGAAV